MKNLDPPMRTSFPHAEPRRRARVGTGPGGRGRPRRGLLRREISSWAESKRPKEHTAGGKEAAPRTPGLGQPRSRPSSPLPEPVVRAETMERAPGDARRVLLGEGGAGRGGGERRRGRDSEGEAGAPRPSPTRASRSPGPVQRTPEPRQPPSRPPSLADPGYAKLLQDRKILFQGAKLMGGLCSHHSILGAYLERDGERERTTQVQKARLAGDALARPSGKGRKRSPAG